MKVDRNLMPIRLLLFQDQVLFMVMEMLLSHPVPAYKGDVEMSLLACARSRSSRCDTQP